MRIVITRRESFDLADGLNAFVFALSDALMEGGHEVFLLSGSGSHEGSIASNFQSSRHTAMYSLSESATASNSDVLGGWRKRGTALVLSLKPDFVIINGGLPVGMPFPSCIVSHDLERRYSYGSLNRRLYKIIAYRRADKIVATCSELRAALAKEILIPEEAISVIPTCVDLPTYKNVPLAQRERAILHMGMPAYKNPAATIKAFAALSCEATLYLTGRPTPEVEAMIGALPQSKRDSIHLVGIVSAEELKRLLCHVRVLSVPSDYHVPVASPTVIDGLASGTPVIGTMGISQDLIRDGVSGFRVSPHDIPTIAEKMNLLLTNDEAWQRMSAHAAERVSAFDNHHVAETYLALATGVNAGRTSARSFSTLKSFSS